VFTLYFTFLITHYTQRFTAFWLINVFNNIICFTKKKLFYQQYLVLNAKNCFKWYGYLLTYGVICFYLYSSEILLKVSQT